MSKTNQKKPIASALKVSDQEKCKTLRALQSATLRAAADQVVPNEPEPFDGTLAQPRRSAVWLQWQQRQETRAKILAFAAALLDLNGWELVEWLNDHAAHLRKMQEIGWLPETEQQESLDRTAELLQQQQQAEIERLRAQQAPVPVELPDEEVATIADRLVELARAVTKERWSEFSMHVPARPLRDADLVISRAAKLLQQQQAEIERLRASAVA
jgi:hypothetical protein